jgi:hypothetical protein
MKRTSQLRHSTALLRSAPALSNRSLPRASTVGRGSMTPFHSLCVAIRSDLAPISSKTDIALGHRTRAASRCHLCARGRQRRALKTVVAQAPSAPARSSHRSRGAYRSRRLRSRSSFLWELRSPNKALQHRAYQPRIYTAFDADDRASGQLDVDRSCAGRTRSRLLTRPRRIR